MKTTQSNRDVFTASNGKSKAAPIICYESVYGEFVTGYVRNGADFLAIVTNDAWWNNTEVTKMFGGDGARSTMVGDMVLVGTEKYMVEKMGWSKI